MAQTAKAGVENTLKDKLKVTHALMLLLSYLAGQIDFSSIESVPITKVAIVFYVGALVLAAYAEDHRHKEKTGHYPEGLDIIDEITKWAKKVCKAYGIEDTEEAEELEQLRKQLKKLQER